MTAMPAASAERGRMASLLRSLVFQIRWRARLDPCRYILARLDGLPEVLRAQGGGVLRLDAIHRPEQEILVALHAIRTTGVVERPDGSGGDEGPVLQQCACMAAHRVDLADGEGAVERLGLESGSGRRVPSRRWSSTRPSPASVSSIGDWDYPSRKD